MRRLLHDFADLTGDLKIPFTVQEQDLDRHGLPAVLGPGQPGGGADHVFRLGLARNDLRRAEQSTDERRGRPSDSPPALGHASHDFTTNLADLALQVPDAGLPRLLTADRLERVLGDAQMFLRDSVLLQLTRDEKPARDSDLLFLDVSRELDDLQAVQQGRWNRAKGVGGGDEDHLGEIVGYLQLMIGEAVVLLGIKDLEQRRRRIAAEILPELVDLVKHEQGIDRTDAAHGLQDPSRQGPDVSSPVASDLGFVADPSQGDADKLPSQGPTN